MIILFANVYKLHCSTESIEIKRKRIPINTIEHCGQEVPPKKTSSSSCPVQHGRKIARARAELEKVKACYLAKRAVELSK